jgi:hypothetical protein
MNATRSKSLATAAVAALTAGGITSSVLAHGDHGQPNPPQESLRPATILQLEDVRQATARFLDVAEAEHAGYVDIGLFVPNMGWHYLKEEVLDGHFDSEEPELLVYADDPCGGPRRLVAIEYAVPLSLSERAPAGFVGRSDHWDVNTDFQLWTLHAWVWEFNPDGVFAPFNPRVVP